MDLNITPTAAARFPKGHDLYILTSNDGSNQFSSAAGCCMIGERFLITPIDEPLDPYNELVSSNQFTFFTSTYDQMFLTGHLILDVQKRKRLFGYQSFIGSLSAAETNECVTKELTNAL